MPLRFEWDPEKAKDNDRKHGVRFEEAASVFYDPFSLTKDDADHSTDEEDRFLTLGLSLKGRIIVVAHCDRGDAIRLISARKANADEAQTYHWRRRRE